MPSEWHRGGGGRFLFSYRLFFLVLCTKHWTIKPFDSVSIHTSFANAMTCLDWSSFIIIIITIRILLDSKWRDNWRHLGFWDFLFLHWCKCIWHFVWITSSVSLGRMKNVIKANFEKRENFYIPLCKRFGCPQMIHRHLPKPTIMDFAAIVIIS